MLVLRTDGPADQSYRADRCVCDHQRPEHACVAWGDGFTLSTRDHRGAVPDREAGDAGQYRDVDRQPLHRYENGKDVSELPLESVANLHCVVVRIAPAAGPVKMKYRFRQTRARAGRYCFTRDGIVTGGGRSISTDISSSRSARPPRASAPCGTCTRSPSGSSPAREGR